MLNSVPPFATVVKIEQIHTSASSSQSAPLAQGIRITALIRPEYVTKIKGKSKLFYLNTKPLRYHLGDVIFDYPPEHIDYSQRKNYFVMTMTTKGAIKAVCQAIIRACQDPVYGYGGLLVGVELEEMARDILNALPGANIKAMKPSDSNSSLVDGKFLTHFHSSSSPGLFDVGDSGQWVVKTNIGSARRSILAQVGIDKMLRVLVNPAFPETMVLYDAEGNRQGYASRFVAFETLADYLDTISSTTGKVTDFLVDNAYAIGQLSAQALFTGNVDVLTSNIAVADHKVIGLFDNDRTVMEYLGKYYGYADALDHLFFSPLNQSDLRSPFKPVNMFTQAWFYRSPHLSLFSIMPHTIEREYDLPGLQRLMQENPVFKIGYFQTLYAFSRLKPIHFERFFSIETNAKRKAQLISIFSQRASQLTTDLWAWSEFCASYFANQTLFEEKVCALALGDAPIHALSAEEIERLIKLSIYEQALESGDRNRLETYLLKLDQREDDCYSNNYRTDHSILNGHAKQIRFLELERLKINDLLTQTRVRLEQQISELLQAQLVWISARIDSHYEVVNRKLIPFLLNDPLQVFISYLDSVLENNSIDYVEFDREVTLLGETLAGFEHSAFLMDILQTQDLVVMQEKCNAINYKLVKLFEQFDPCPVELWSVNPDNIHTLVECNEIIQRLETASTILMTLENLCSMQLIFNDALLDIKERMQKADELKKLLSSCRIKRSQMNLESILISSISNINDTIDALNQEHFAFCQPMKASLLNNFWNFFNTHAHRSHEVLRPLFDLTERIKAVERDERITCLNEALVIIDSQLKVNNGLSELLQKLRLTNPSQANLDGLRRKPIGEKDLNRLLLSLRSSLNIEVFSKSYEHYKKGHQETRNSQASRSFFPKDKVLFGNIETILKRYATHQLKATDAWSKINELARVFSAQSEFFRQAFNQYKSDDIWQPPMEAASSESSAAPVIR